MGLRMSLGDASRACSSLASSRGFGGSARAVYLSRPRAMRGSLLCAGVSPANGYAARSCHVAGRARCGLPGAAAPGHSNRLSIVGRQQLRRPISQSPGVSRRHPGRGSADQWYTEAKASADLALFHAVGVSPRVHVFEDGHVWHDTFVQAAGEFLDSILKT